MKSSAETLQDPFSDLMIQSFKLYTGSLLAFASLSKNQLQMGLEMMNLFFKPGRQIAPKPEPKKFNELQEAIGCKEF